MRPPGAARRSRVEAAHGAGDADGAAGDGSGGDADDRSDRIVVVNMGSAPASVAVRGTVLVSSDGTGEGVPFTGTLAPDQAVLIVPSR